MDENTRTLPELGKVTLLETYQYYDGPRSFSCVDEQGQKYIGLWVDFADEVETYLYIPVDDARLADAEANRVSITELIASPKPGWVWEVKEILYSFYSYQEVVRKLATEKIPRTYFPDDQTVTLSGTKRV
jgi:hypothetical protein